MIFPPETDADALSVLPNSKTQSLVYKDAYVLFDAPSQSDLSEIEYTAAWLATGDGDRQKLQGLAFSKDISTDDFQ